MGQAGLGGPGEHRSCGGTGRSPGQGRPQASGDVLGMAERPLRVPSERLLRLRACCALNSLRLGLRFCKSDNSLPTGSSPGFSECVRAKTRTVPGAHSACCGVTASPPPPPLSPSLPPSPSPPSPSPSSNMPRTRGSPLEWPRTQAWEFRGVSRPWKSLLSFVTLRAEAGRQALLGPDDARHQRCPPSPCSSPPSTQHAPLLATSSSWPRSKR